MGPLAARRTDPSRGENKQSNTQILRAPPAEAVEFELGPCWATLPRNFGGDRDRDQASSVYKTTNTTTTSAPPPHLKTAAAIASALSAAAKTLTLAAPSRPPPPAI